MPVTRKQFDDLCELVDILRSEIVELKSENVKRQYEGRLLWNCIVEMHGRLWRK